MRGSWAGAMGHTQWDAGGVAHVGLDYDGDRAGDALRQPDDALAGTAPISRQARQVSRREHWGYEVRGAAGRAAQGRHEPTKAGRGGVTRADGKAFPRPNASARLWAPVPGGPAFLLAPNSTACASYNPSDDYTLSIVHLGDRIMGGGPLVQPFPVASARRRSPKCRKSRARLTALGFDTGGTDGRVGNDKP